MERQYPHIIYPVELDERTVFEMHLKGWVQAIVETENGQRYSFYFTDLVRLKQDVDAAIAQGEPGFAEIGMIVISEVTPENIERAIAFLWVRGYFDSLKSLAD